MPINQGDLPSCKAVLIVLQISLQLAVVRVDSRECAQTAEQQPETFIMVFSSCLDVLSAAIAKVQRGIISPAANPNYTIWQLQTPPYLRMSG